MNQVAVPGELHTSNQKNQQKPKKSPFKGYHNPCKSGDLLNDYGPPCAALKSTSAQLSQFLSGDQHE